MSTQEKTAQVVGQVSRQVVDGFEARVESWLGKHVTGCADARVVSLHSPTSGGLSGETYLITVEGQQASSRRTLVLKKDVAENKTNPQTNFAHLVKAQTALGDIDGLPVPRVLGFEPSPSPLGAPFVVMEFVAGDIAADVPSYAACGWVRDASQEQRSRLWRSGVDFLVRLHKLDARTHGLDRIRFDAPGTDDLERCVNYAIEMFRKEVTGQTPPLCERAISWLRANRPAPDVSCFCWGDARIGNIIWRDFECAAAIDWEMCGMGCPGMDVGWWSFVHRWSTYGQGHPDLTGMCVGQELADLYAARGGDRIEHILYYEVLAVMRLMSVWLRLSQVLMTHGKLPPMDPLGNSVHIVRVLSDLMDQAN